jgi:ATP-dependent Clp protease ATP-binding subunit ClpC
MDKYSLSRLVGSGPGYVDSDKGGQLTEAVRRKPYCCVLFDEIEKAHEDIFNILLQVFDDGHLTDAMGRKVSFRNAIIIMTSNIGAEQIRKGSNMGFATQTNETKVREQNYGRMKDKLLEELKKRFRPEFINRLDGMVVFHSLSKDNIRNIVDLMLKVVYKQLAEKNISLQVTEAAKDLLGEKGFDEVFGARPLKRAIQDMIVDRLSESILRGEFVEKDVVRVDVVDVTDDKGVTEKKITMEKAPIPVMAAAT